MVKGLQTRRVWRAQSDPSYPWIEDPWSNPSLINLGARTDSLLISQGNPAPYGRQPQNGGDFYQRTFEYRLKPSKIDLKLKWDNTLVHENRGHVGPVNYVLASQERPSFTALRSLMIPMGTLGWNRMSPGKPLASLSQFLGELRQLPKNPVRMARELVSSMRQAGSKTAGADMLRRSVGDHYLNWSFGWRPFLDDLRKFAEFNNSLYRTLDQLYRDQGRTVRRRGTISQTRTSTTTVNTSGSTAGYMPQLLTYYDGKSRRTVQTTITERYWFSAGFNFRMPNVNDADAMQRLRQYLLGGGISPSIVWELTPWSWLADYFTSIGAALENWDRSRALHLAAKYAYVMYKRDVSVVSSHESWANNQAFRLAASATSRMIIQARTGASAYGFGFTSGSLNNGQIANLVALGLSRRI